MDQVCSIYLPLWDLQITFPRPVWPSRVSPAPARGYHPPQALIVPGPRGQEVVARACPAAERLGIRPGMPLAEARAIEPALQTAPLDGAKSRSCLELLARWAWRFSPTVAVDPTPWPRDSHLLPSPDGLLLDVSGMGALWNPEDPFGGEALLLTEIGQRLRRHGLAARLAVAPSIGAAWALARYGEHPQAIVRPDHVGIALGALPTAALRLPVETLNSLGQVEIQRVAALLKIPRRELLDRFGPEILRRIDQAFGREPELLTPVRAELTFGCGREFEGACADLAAVMACGQELLEALCGQLLTHERGARELVLKVRRAEAPPVELRLALGRASRKSRHLWGLLRLKIEKLNLGGGIEALALEAPWTVRMKHTQVEAWQGDSEEEGGIQEFLDTVVNRGVSAWRMRERASHVPERAMRMELESGKSGRDQELAGRGERPLDWEGHRPAVLLEKAERIEVLGLVPDAPPSAPKWLRWRGLEHVVTAALGPERIGEEWWEGRRGVRDYFQVQTEGGGWFWVYRELLTGQWFMAGAWV